MRAFAVKPSDFKTSSYSDPGGIIKTCVEVAVTPEGVAVRNSNDPMQTTLYYTPTEWRAFTDGVKNNEFNI